MDQSGDVTHTAVLPKRMLNLSSVKATAKNQPDTANNAPAGKASQANIKKEPARVVSLSHIKAKNEALPGAISENIRDTESETDICALEDVSISDNNICDSTRIRPNTLFLNRFIGSIERSNMRNVSTTQKAVCDYVGSTDGAASSLEAFRSEGRQKMLQLAEHYGFSVQIKVKTAEPVGFKRSCQNAGISARLGEGQPVHDETVAESSKAPAKKKNKKQKVEVALGNGPASVLNNTVAASQPAEVAPQDQATMDKLEKGAQDRPATRSIKPKKPPRSAATANLFKSAMTGIKK